MAINCRKSTSLRVDLGYTDVSYDTDTLTDYSYWTLGGSWSQEFSELTGLSVSLNAARQDAENAVTSHVIGLSAGIRQTFSPRLNADLSIGPRYSFKEFSFEEQGSLGVAFGTGLQYAWTQRTSLSATASQSVEPSGGGALRNRLRLGVYVEHRYLPRLTLSISADFQNDTDPSDNDRSTARNYVTFSPRFKWKMTEEWDLSGSYRFRRQEFSDAGTAANSNVVLVTVTYHPFAWFISG